MYSGAIQVSMIKIAIDSFIIVLRWIKRINEGKIMLCFIDWNLLEMPKPNSKSYFNSFISIDKRNHSISLFENLSKQTISLFCIIKLRILLTTFPQWSRKHNLELKSHINLPNMFGLLPFTLQGSDLPASLHPLILVLIFFISSPRRSPEIQIKK